MLLSSDNGRMVQAYREIVSFCNENQDDYFFLIDIPSGNMYFFGNMAKKYAVLQSGREFCLSDEWFRIVYPLDIPMLHDDLASIQSGSLTVYDKEFRLINKKGEIVWVTCRGKVLFDDAGSPELFVGRMSDNALKSKTDVLTGTFRMEGLQEEIAAILKNNIPGYLLLIGIDNLKEINLKNGREYGDEILKRTAESIEYAVNGIFRVYRSVGDCFAVNAIYADGIEVQNIFTRIQSRLKGYCTVSAAGVPFHIYKVPAADTLYQYAENTLNTAKHGGKNTLLFFSAEDYEKDIATLQLQEELKASIENGFAGFSLYYQPQVEITTYRLYGAEALLRYRSPVKGPISPAQCIPILEHTRLLCPLGMWILETALKQCAVWRQTIPDFHISVNMSYIQLQEEGIAEKVLEAVRASGVPSQALTIELTESMQLFDFPAINTIFQQWKKAGIRISIDDFGTGYSSFSRLKLMDINEIKIDRMFVNSIQNSAYNHRLLSNLLEFADDNQITVCCEGIETEEELAVLEKLRPSLLQGFLFSKPCDAAVFESLYIDTASESFRSRSEHEQMLRDKFSVEKDSGVLGLTEDDIAVHMLRATNDVYYLRDTATYELYFLNRAGQKLFGLRDFKGKRCYEALYGRTEPCEICTRAAQELHDFCIWNFRNEYCGQNFIFKGSAFSYNDKPMFAGILFGGTKYELLSPQTRDRVRLAETAVKDMRRIAAFTDISESVQEALRTLGEFYQADHAYMIEFTKDAVQSLFRSNEWYRGGTRVQPDKKTEVPREILLRWLSLFKQNKSVIILNVSELKETYPFEWQILSMRGIANLIATPMYSGGQLLAFICIDNPKSAMQDDSMMQITAAFLLVRLRQRYNELRYQRLLSEKSSSILRLTGIGLWQLELNEERRQYALICDDTLLSLLGITDVFSGEACYRFWYARIGDGYYSYVTQAMQAMMDSQKTVELMYTWKHPAAGDVQIRCIGSRAADQGDMICLQGQMEIVSGMTRLSPVFDYQLPDIFEFNESSKTIFFHSNRTLIAGEELREEHFPDCWIQSGIVHEQCAVMFRRFFSRIRLKKDSEMPRILLKTKNGSYAYFRLSLRHLGFEARDLDAVIIKIERWHKQPAVKASCSGNCQV